jgi:hypothetical protein
MGCCGARACACALRRHYGTRHAQRAWRDSPKINRHPQFRCLHRVCVAAARTNPSGQCLSFVRPTAQFAPHPQPVQVVWLLVGNQQLVAVVEPSGYCVVAPSAGYYVVPPLVLPTHPPPPPARLQSPRGLRASLVLRPYFIHLSPTIITHTTSFTITSHPPDWLWVSM